MSNEGKAVKMLWVGRKINFVQSDSFPWLEVFGNISVRDLRMDVQCNRPAATIEVAC